MIIAITAERVDITTVTSMACTKLTTDNALGIIGKPNTMRRASGYITRIEKMSMEKSKTQD
jgi:hypothetical protein